jgi:hypothetical protein
MATHGSHGAGPIELGSYLFTLVEPERGCEVEYNRWYERDHFYAGCMTLAHNFAGDRFVATASLKKLRYPAESQLTPDIMTGSYLAIYWVLKGYHDEWNQQSVERVLTLHENGRMFNQRAHIHTALYEHTWAHRPDDRGTPAELALDRGYDGIVVTVGELAEGRTQDEVEAWFRDEWEPQAFAAPWGPDLIVSGAPLPLLEDSPVKLPMPDHPDRVFMSIHFLLHDPAEGWDDGWARFGEQLEASGIATHLWTAPFIQTVFGTDAYTDQLW